MGKKYTIEEQIIIEQAKTDGTYLKAPNRENTNLSPEQWLQVRTVAFKDWFGDWENDPGNASKILDQNGEPKVMFHGSKSSFTEFDSNKSGSSNTMGQIGFWFSSMKSFAQEFAEGSWWGKEDHASIYNTFLSIKNPKVYEKRNLDKDIESLKNELTSIRSELNELNKKWLGDWRACESFNIAINNRFPNDKAREYYANRTPDSRQAILDGERASDLLDLEKILSDKLYEYKYNDPYERLRTDFYKLAGMNAYNANFNGIGMAIDNENEVSNKFKENLRLQGFDGIIIRGTKYDSHFAGGVLNDQYVAFNSNQIKSALDNVGTFSLENNDIRYRFIGEQGIALGTESLSKNDLLTEIRNISETLCIPIETIKDLHDIDISEKRKAKGWFESSTGKVVIVLPNVESVSDLQATIMHEVVAHKGLSGLLGDKLSYMMNCIYNNLPDTERVIIQQNAIDHYKGNISIATEEYLAQKAEKGVFEPSLWVKVKSAIKDFFRSIGIELTMKDYELNNLLWKGGKSLSTDQTVSMESNKDPEIVSNNHTQITVMNVFPSRQITKQNLIM